MNTIVYTIGHSTHPIDHFTSLLRQHNIDAVADVRSSPYSRLHPQFNRESLRDAMCDAGISYVFLGKELGARSEDPSCYRDGKAQYDRVAATPLFQRGLDRVTIGAERFTLALMCAEKDPLDCHRTILVARWLLERNLSILHILPDGGIETHEQAMDRLVKRLQLPSSDLFRSRDEIHRNAYSLQGMRIAYVKASGTNFPTVLGNTALQRKSPI